MAARASFLSCPCYLAPDGVDHSQVVPATAAAAAVVDQGAAAETAADVEPPAAAAAAPSVLAGLLASAAQQNAWQVKAEAHSHALAAVSPARSSSKHTP